MTNKEAIRNLENWKLFDKKIVEIDGDLGESIRLAIKALEREENLEQVVVADYIAGYEVGYSEGMEFQKKQRPQGEWIPQTAYDGFTYWKCSECGKKNDYAKTKFCWHCGADMREETEE